MALLNHPERCLAHETKIIIYSHENQWLATNIWRVSEAALKKLPLWNPEEGPPPLPINKAVKLAKAWLISRGADTNLWLYYIKIRPIGPGQYEYRDTYFYNIYFGGVGIVGHYQRCIILMDGTIVDPEWLDAKPRKKSPWNYDE